jgi:hypothetical protein
MSTHSPPKEKRGCNTALKTEDAEAYTGRELRQPKTRRLIRQRLAQLQRCTSLDRIERHVVRFLLRRKRFRILEKDLINRLYAEHLEGAP